MPVTPPQVSILIVNYNGSRMLQSCIDSLHVQRIQEFEVIVVDNGSTDRSADLPVFQQDERFTLIQLEKNTGYAEANNLAYEASSAPYVVLLNNDVELDPEWLREMLKAAEGDRVGSVACQLRQKANPELLDSRGFRMYFNGSTETDYGDSIKKPQFHDAPFGAVAAAALYTREALCKVGFLFHPEYFAYYEDTDLAFRLRLHGFEVAYAPEAIGWHVGSATGQRFSAFHGFHLRRNIAYVFWVNFSRKHLFWYSPLYLLSEGLAMLYYTFRGQPGVFFRAKYDAFRHCFWIFRERRVLQKAIQAHHQDQAEKDILGPVAYLRKKLNLFFTPVLSE